MNKKVLSAILFSALFAGTGTFTSCIDNDEPAGIEELRGAKAELLKAQAAFELAETKLKEAEAALKLADVRAKEIANEAAEIDNQIKELDLKVREAKTEAEIADYLLQKQQKENALAKLAETFKADMLDAQAKTVEAQTKLDNAIAQAEIAKLTLDAESQALVDAALEQMNTKKTAMIIAYGAVVAGQNAVVDALKADAKGVSLSKLENDLLVAQIGVKKEEIKIADAKKMLELAKNFDTETWAAQLDSLRADSLAAVQDKAAAQVDLDALYMGTEYQAAEKAYADAAEKLGLKQTNKAEWTTVEDKKSYQKGLYAEKATEKTYGDNNDSTLHAKLTAAQKDSTAAVNGSYKYDEKKNLTTTFTIKAYESEPVDEALALFLNKLSIKNYADGEFSYTGGEYNETAYRKDSTNYKEAVAEDKLNEYTATSAAMNSLMTVEGWVNALSTFKADTNGLAWSQVGLDVAREDSALAQKEFDAAKAAWKILVDAVNLKKTVAPTDSVSVDVDGTKNYTYDLAGSIATYNDSIASLAAAVANYNKAIDSIAYYEKTIYDAKYNSHITTTKNAYYLNEYIKYAVDKSLISTENKAKYDEAIAADSSKETLATFNTYMTAVDAAVCKAAVDLLATKYNNDKDGKEVAAMTELKENAAVLAKEAVVEDYNAKESVLAPYVGAYEEAKTTMKDVANYVATEWGNVKTTYASYMNLLEADYGQVITATNLTKYLPENATDSVEVGKAVYVSYAEDYPTTADKTVLWNVIEADFGGVAGIDELPDYTEKNDSVYTSYTKEVYTKYMTVGSDVSEAEEANLSVTSINKKLAIENLAGKSATAFGSIFDWKENTEARLVEVTKEMIEADAEKKDRKINENNYGKLGALMEAEAAVELILAYKDADKLAKPVLEAIEAHYAALKAEIAANSAIVEAVEKKADEAWTAFYAGKALVEKALADRDALSAEAEAEIKLLEAIIAEKSAVIESATQQLKALFNEVEGLPGALTTEKLIVSWEEAVANAESALETAKLSVAEAEKAIELYKSGEYSQAYAVAMAQLKLEAAQEAYEAAVKLYELAAAEFNAILEALAK